MSLRRAVIERVEAVTSLPTEYQVNQPQLYNTCSAQFEHCRTVVECDLPSTLAVGPSDAGINFSRLINTHIMAACRQIFSAYMPWIVRDCFNFRHCMVHWSRGNCYSRGHSSRSQARCQSEELRPTPVLVQ